MNLHAGRTEAVAQQPSRPPAPQRDRRDSRWDEHRRARREELIEATLRAVTRHGAGVGMEDIAAEAGTSKTVVYRHFGDRSELHSAVCDRVARRLTRALRKAVTATDDPREMVSGAVETYLGFLEADPEIYRFVTSGTGGGTGGSRDPLASLSDLIGEAAAELVGVALRRADRDATAAQPWGHGLVGLVRAAADRWLRDGRQIPRAELTDQLTDLAWGGLAGLLGTTTTLQKETQ
ncbi:MAG: TetR family transcriptional regulator [Actinomycetales bacterium]